MTREPTDPPPTRASDNAADARDRDGLRGRFLQTPEGIFLWLGLLSGVVSLLVTPPFQVPDEQVHFFRAYQLSQGHVVAEHLNGQTGGHLPKSVPETVDRLLAPLAGRPEEKVDLEAVTRLMTLPLNRTETRFVAFESSAVYSPIPYLPQVLGISIGKLFDLSPLALLYLARLSSLVVAVSLLCLAIRTVPILKWSYFLIAVSPMAMFQMASVSADGFTVGIALLVSALLARYASSAATVTGGRLLVLTAAATLLTLSKQYLLIPLLYFMIPWEKVGSPRRYVGFFLVLIGACALGLAAWLTLVRSVYVPVGWVPGVDPAAQARLILSSPLAFLELALTDYLSSMPGYVDQMTGRYLGWVDTELPLALIRSHQVLLVLTAVLDTRSGIRVTWTQRGVALAVLCANMLLVSTLLYLSNNPVGAPTVVGIQGRYFIPLLPLFLLVLHNGRLGVSNERLGPGQVAGIYFRAAICLYAVLVSLVTIHTLVERYYGFAPAGVM